MGAVRDLGEHPSAGGAPGGAGPAGEGGRWDSASQPITRGTAVPIATPVMAAAVDDDRASAPTPNAKRAKPMATNTADNGHHRPSPWSSPASAPTTVRQPAAATASADQAEPRVEVEDELERRCRQQGQSAQPEGAPVGGTPDRDLLLARSPATATRRAPVACSPRASTLSTMRIPMTAENWPNPVGPISRAAATVSPYVATFITTIATATTAPSDIPVVGSSRSLTPTL